MVKVDFERLIVNVERHLVALGIKLLRYLDLNCWLKIPNFENFKSRTQNLLFFVEFTHSKQKAFSSWCHRQLNPKRNCTQSVRSQESVSWKRQEKRQTKLTYKWKSVIWVVINFVLKIHVTLKISIIEVSLKFSVVLTGFIESKTY